MKIKEIKKLLIIDDEKENLRLHHIALHMESLGYEVTYSNNIFDVLLERYFPISLIVLNLDETAGSQIIRFLKEGHKTKNIPVVALTRDGETGIDVGADEYLVKHMSPKEMVKTVKMLMDRSSQKIHKSLRRESNLYCMMHGRNEYADV